MGAFVLFGGCIACSRDVWCWFFCVTVVTTYVVFLRFSNRATLQISFVTRMTAISTPRYGIGTLWGFNLLECA